MDWKTRLGLVGGGVSAMIAFITGVFPSDIAALLDSFVPNAGFYIVRIVFGVASIYVFAVLICIGYFFWFRRFKAEIVGKKSFLLGGVVAFKASYRGKLENGFFTCRVLPPKGKVLPSKEKTYEWWPCYGTFQHTKASDVGILRGSGNHEFSWEAKIPEGYPEGEYTAFVGVYESSASGNKCVKEKRLSFLVVDPKNVFSGSPGVTGVYTGEIPWRTTSD